MKVTAAKEMSIPQGEGVFGAPGGTDSDPGGGQRAEADTHHGAGEGGLENWRSGTRIILMQA